MAVPYWSTRSDRQGSRRLMAVLTWMSGATLAMSVTILFRVFP